MKKRIVIIGGGFGGLESALSLWEILESQADITLIDRNACHSFIPSIHEIISGKVGARDIQIPLSVVLSPTTVTFLQDEVVSIDPWNRQVITPSRVMEFDYLVLSSGAEDNFFGVPGAAEFSHPFRSPESAERISATVKGLLKNEKRPCRLIVAGGGTEGVEVAGELLDLVRETGSEHDMASGRITVALIDRSRLLNTFPVKAQDFVEEYLSQRGVKIFAGSRITEVRKREVVLDPGARYGMSVLIWTGGLQPSKLLRGLPLSKDDQGWLRVTESLQSPDTDRIYGVGDAISMYNERGAVALSRLAYHALDQARVAGRNIANHIRGRRTIAYSPKTKPQLLSLGKDMGIFVRGEYVFSGQSVVLLKKMVQIRHIMTYLTRPSVSALSAKLREPKLRYLMRWLLPI
ncbi:MAG TPA: FAD-dependent oxidoreductase [Thermodesulfovibrionales bacterium]|nr:FAD-dependent oxidoreductase [Thermodesulfovibrionales bacterium]